MTEHGVIAEPDGTRVPHAADEDGAGADLTPTRWPTESPDPDGLQFLRSGQARALGAPRMDGPAPAVAYAAFGWRAVALAVDAAVAAFVVSAVNQVGLTIQFGVGGPEPGWTLAQDALGALAVVIGFGLAWTTVGASPGHLVAGLRALREADGQRLGFGPALGRAVLLFGPWLVAAEGLSIVSVLRSPPFGDSGPGPSPAGLIIGIGALIWYALLAWSTLENARGQGWHDTLCGSVVVGPAD